MAKQDRALRTRQAVLEAAAVVFEERGYQAATITDILQKAGVTKGALYFHFKSKEHLAQGVLAEQDQLLAAPTRTCKIQQVIDTICLQAYRLQTEPMVRAGVSLTLDQKATELDRSGPFLRWTQVLHHLLEQSHQRGELLPHVNPTETAEVLVGAFAGIQAMAQTLTRYHDLPQRITTLLHHILPTITHPSTLITLTLTPEHGATIHTQATTPTT
ncbi:ScbR family autoregulator-binding transcription factor [Streptomyces cyaneofuscatus]|uniref:ScbR family autoregulator-binding transcription factor n=1 Tax=Streptomyces cyaneofuscatus TaxID=66883 RepID=UPI003662691B